MSTQDAAIAAPAAAVQELAGAEGWRRTFASLRNEPYRWLWVGMLFSFTSMQMQQVARGYLAYRLEGTATALGIVGLGWGVPMLLFSLIGGAVADRSVKRNLLFVTQSAMGVLSLITAILVHAGVVQVWHLLVVGLGQGTVFAFNGPARNALVPELVGEGEIVNAVALNNAAMQLTRVLGPSLAGGLIAVPFVGLTGTFYIMAALYIGSVVTLVRVPAIAPHDDEPRGAVTHEVAQGLRYIWGRPRLLTLIAMAMVLTLVGMPYQILLPAFAEDVFHVDSVGLGVMVTAVGAGAVVGALVVAYLSDSPRRGEFQVLAGLGFGLALAAFAASGMFAASVIALVAVGLMSTGYLSINTGLIMEQTQRQYYGRVMSLYMMTWSLMPLAALPLSVAADGVGLRPTVGVAGVFIAVFVMAAALLYPAIRLRGRRAGEPASSGTPDGP